METEWFRIEFGENTFSSKERATTLEEGWVKTEEKWELMKLGLRPTSHGECCGLCNLFLRTDDNACDGCPIKNHTGAAGCHKTPYVIWMPSQSDKNIIQEEIDFLRKVKGESQKPKLETPKYGDHYYRGNELYVVTLLKGGKYVLVNIHWGSQYSVESIDPNRIFGSDREEFTKIDSPIRYFWDK